MSLRPMQSHSGCVLTCAYVLVMYLDTISDVAKHMGADRVLFGSDWPHMEGLQHPQDIFDELDVVDLAQQKLILHDNAAALNQRQT